MSSGVIVHAEPDSRREVAGRLPGPGVGHEDGPVEKWLRGHVNVFAFGVMAAGFVARLVVAGRSYLNPDEALHYLLLNQPSAFLAYKASLTNAHPPLIYLLVYFWRFLGRSELMLRIPSVLAGTMLCWVAYKWIGKLFGVAAGMIGIILVAFSPAIIALSAELRPYALLLLCETAALYLIEIAFQEYSVCKLWYFSLFLYLAILTHYSAIFFALAAGVYALARIANSPPTRKFFVAWAVGQAGALAIYGFLYITHVSKVRSRISLWAMPFDLAYFHPGRDHLLSFTWQRTLGIFLFLFENRYTSQAMLVLWVTAALYLLARRFASREESSPRWQSGILLLLPFVAVWGAAIAGLYPYVGTRHTLFLAPFMIAAVSFPLAYAYGQKIWAAITIALLLVGATGTAGRVIDPFISKENQSRTLMAAAVQDIRQSIPPGDMILTDYQSALMAAYYLCGPKVRIPVDTFYQAYARFDCNGRSIVSLQEWSLSPKVFSAEFQGMARAMGLEAGSTVWVFEAGWGTNLAQRLPWVSPQFRCLDSKSFGANITLIPFAVSPDFSPAETVTNCPPPAFNSLVQ